MTYYQRLGIVGFGLAAVYSAGMAVTLAIYRLSPQAPAAHLPWLRWGLPALFAALAVTFGLAFRLIYRSWKTGLAGFEGKEE